MARPALLAALLLTALTLAACQHQDPEAPAPEQTEPLDPATIAPLPVAKPDLTSLLPIPGKGEVPHIYMALQDEGDGKPVSAVFAIDAARNNTPSDDRAVRLTPDAGLCNPQEMTRFDFPPEYAAKPMVSEIEQAEGLTVLDLPAYMAISVTNEMLSLGLAAEPEETRPLNVCTRKLWERLVLTENSGALTSGQ